MRRLVAFVAVAAALITASTAAAGLQPVRRDPDTPRVRAGTIRVPPGHATGRVRVIVRLGLPPLAEAAQSFLGARPARRLSVASTSSRGYLARVRTEQARAVATLRRAIPEARVSRRFQVVLNGVTVDLPAAKLPALARLRLGSRIYPSLGYRLAINRSRGVMGGAALTVATGARGWGVKIAVVDDGVDPANPFFDPSGFQYPAGFPKGGRPWTTPKIIVARAFPGPGSGRRGRIALDRRASFHGTHVAGIAAGREGTTSPGGRDHPPATGLSGVAPRAWIGNYRVFTVPTSIGHTAQTPEIVAAFEAAVRDGMDIVNFSGGGPQTDPANDALVEAVANVAAAGLLPVISAGNDRDDFGMGSAGAPGTAPEAISVAAVTNTRVYGEVLTIAGRRFQYVPAAGILAPRAWTDADQTLVDVGTLVGTDAKPVDRRLCGLGNPNTGSNPLPSGSLAGAIALVARGRCTFVSKAVRARQAGARGIVFVDNRPGEANPIPLALPLPAGMVADLDGAEIRGILAGRGGRGPVRIGREPVELETGRSGVVTSFSAGGPTAFEHLLKPDVAAPGDEILSSTLSAFGGPFVVFPGTSMAAPHVSGAAALLVERHPTWTPRQIKSALSSTAGPAWGNTTRTQEASVLLAGAGLINASAADDPQIFTEPSSLSFRDLNVADGARRRPLLLSLTDAGGGSGTWAVEVHAQSATAGASLQVAPAVTLAPGGTVELPVTAGAAADAAAGDNVGFLVLRRGPIARRVPYAFFVMRPALASLTPRKLLRFQLGTTAGGESKVSAYRFPSFPFRPPPDYAGPGMDEKGSERLYVTRVNGPAANAGVAVTAASRGSLVHPWFLGSPDENDVQGYSGTPVNVNALTLTFQADVGAAGVLFPRRQRFFVVVDSGSDEYTGRSFAGGYLLRSWKNDVRPPSVRMLTTRVAAGRPLIAVRVTDRGAGVDPVSLFISYRRVLIAAAAYDPFSGLAVFPIPSAAPRLPAGRVRTIVVASDFQEAKNVDQAGANVLPNTRFRVLRLSVVRRPAVTWLAPLGGGCVRRQVSLLVSASSTRRIRSVGFLDGRRRVGVDRRGTVGLYATVWNARRARPGAHRLRAVAVDAAGRTATAARVVRVCRRR